MLTKCWSLYTTKFAFNLNIVLNMLASYHSLRYV